MSKEFITKAFIDPDARVWDENGTEYTVIPYPDGLSYNEMNQKTVNWMEEHLEGCWFTTPAHICFEIPSDALMFKLGYNND